jgi:hypothetical protein
MSSNPQINDFLARKYREMPELHDKAVDELIDDLARDVRPGSAI